MEGLRAGTRCRRRSSAEQALQCGYCTAGHGRHRRRAARAGARRRRGRRPARARRQPVPLRRAQPHRPGGARRAGRARDDAHPSLENNPRLGSWLTLEPDGRVARPVGQGRARAGRAHRARADRRRGARRRPGAGRDGRRRPPTRAPTSPTPPAACPCSTPGSALRAVCAQVRALHLAAAAERLGVAGATTSRSPTARSARPTAAAPATGSWPSRSTSTSPAATPKSPADYTVVGRSAPRLDVPDKVAGRPRFIHDLRPPGCSTAACCGRRRGAPSCCRSTSPRHGRCRASSPSSATARSSASSPSARRTRCARSPRCGPAPPGGSRTRCRAERDAGRLPACPRPTEETVLSDTPTTAARRPARTVGARAVHPALPRPRVHRPVVRAGALGRRAAVGVVALAGRLQAADGDLPARWTWRRSTVVVQHVEGAGCYGHNAADDAAYDAVLLARAVPGRPVQVVWTREDELSWGPLGPAMVVDIEADVDDDRRGCSAGSTTSGATGTPTARARPAPPLLAATHVEAAVPSLPASDPPLQNGGGSGRNAVPLLRPARASWCARTGCRPCRCGPRRCARSAPTSTSTRSSRWSTSWRRWPGVDPVEYRLRMLTDERARAVLQAAAERAGWGARPGPGRRPRGRPRPLQEPRRVVRRRRGGGGGDVGAGAPADDRRGRRPGGEPGRRGQPDRGRGAAGAELDDEGAGPLRRPHGHQPDVGGLPDPDASARCRRSTSSCSTGRTSRRWAPARPRSGRPRPPSATRCTRPPGCASANLPLTPANVVAAMDVG